MGEKEMPKRTGKSRRKLKRYSFMDIFVFLCAFFIFSGVIYYFCIIDHDQEQVTKSETTPKVKSEVKVKSNKGKESKSDDKKNIKTAGSQNKSELNLNGGDKNPLKDDKDHLKVPDDLKKPEEPNPINNTDEKKKIDVIEKKEEDGKMETNNSITGESEGPFDNSNNDLKEPDTGNIGPTVNINSNDYEKEIDYEEREKKEIDDDEQEEEEEGEDEEEEEEGEDEEEEDNENANEEEDENGDENVKDENSEDDILSNDGKNLTQDEPTEGENLSENARLIDAIKTENIQLLNELIQANLITTEPIENGLKAFHYAANLIKLDALRLLLATNLFKVTDKVQDGDYAGSTVMHLVCLASGDYPDKAIEAVDFLLNNDADIKIEDDEGFTPIVSAVVSNNTALVEFFLSKGESVNSTFTLLEHSLLHIAMGPCHRPMIKFLIDKGADIHHINKVNREPIHEAAAVGCVDGLRELILTRRVSKQQKTPPRSAKLFNENYEEHCLFGASPLHFAAKYNDLSTTEFLFLIQSKFDEQDEDKEIAMNYTARGSQLENYFHGRYKWEYRQNSSKQDIEFLLREAEETSSPSEVEDFYNQLRRTDLHK